MNTIFYIIIIIWLTYISFILSENFDLLRKKNKEEKPETITYFTIDLDYVVMAVGSKPDENVLNSMKLEKNKWGYIQVNEFSQTSDEKVFCAGDISGEKATVAWAASSGRKAAENISKIIK